MVATSFLSTLFLALAVAAHPVERAESFPQLSFTKCFADGVFNIFLQDLLRAKSLLGINTFAPSSPATNRAASYVASVGVGSPPTNYDLIIDSGSANIWVGSSKPYVKTSTSHETSDSVNATYGSGNFNGTEFIDQVTISPILVIPKQSIGVASTSTGFSTVDGIMGVGPRDLTKDTLPAHPKATIPTVTDSLFADHTIVQHLLSISFEPITTNNATVGQVNGQLTWGGVDPTKFIGALTFTPITTTSPASTFWGIDASISYGVTTTLLAKTAGIVDTGTTLVLIATDALKKYQQATGAVLDSATGLLKVTNAQYAKIESVFVEVEGVPFELTRNAQTWPRQLNTFVGGVDGSIYLIVSDLGTPSGSGNDFFLGQCFLERFYSVYDTGNQRVGLARTEYTDAMTN